MKGGLVRTTTYIIGGLLFLASLTCCEEDLEARQKEDEAILLVRGRAVEDRGPPKDLKAEGLSTHAIQVTWTAPDEIPEYYLVEEPITSYNEQTNELTGVLTGLVACSTYTVTVSSCYDGGSVCMPATADGTTRPSTPAAPTNCQITNVTHNYILLKWDAPESPCPLSYQVSWTYEVVQDGETGSGDDSTTDTKYSGNNLFSETIYKYEIKAETDAGLSPDALKCDETTTLVNPEGPPVNLTAEALSNTELQITWAPPEDSPQYYTVDIQGVNSVDVYGLSYIASGLQPCKAYDVTVSSVYDTSTFSATTEGKIFQYESPALVSCDVTDITSDHLRVSWDRPFPSCGITGYVISWSFDVLWSDEANSGKENTTSTSFPLSNLIPYTNYSFDISSHTDVSISKPVTCFGTTDETEPGVIQVIDVEEGIGEATISWLPPSDVNGVIVHYKVNIPSVSDGEKIVNGTEQEVTFSGLPPCTDYQAEVSAATSKGYGPTNSSEVFSLEYDVSPINTTSRVTGASTVTVCWEPANPDCPVIKYLLRWTGDILWSDGNDDNRMEVAGNSSSSDEVFCQDLEGLVPYTSYTFCVGVEPDPSGRCAPLVQTLEDAPSAPILHELEANSDSLEISWSEPVEKNGVLTSYRLSCSSSSDEWNSTDLDPNTLTYTLMDLPRCETYSVVVMAATGGGGWGGESIPQEAPITNSFSESGLVCSGDDSRKSVLDWSLEGEDCPVTHYIVTWDATVLWSMENISSSEMIGGEETSYTLEGLSPWSNFEVCMKVEGSIDEVACCTNITQEDQSTPPTSLNTQTNAKTITITWKPPESPNGNLIGWVVDYSPKDPAIGVVTLDDSDREYTFTDLEPGTKYTISVQARNGYGLSEPAKIEDSISKLADEGVDDLVIGLSVTGGLLLLVALLAGGYYYKKKKKGTRSHGSKGVNNGGVDTDDKDKKYDSYSHDMYEQQQKSYKNKSQEPETTEDILEGGSGGKARLSVLTLSLMDVKNKENQQMTEKMKKNFGEHGILPRLSMAPNETGSKKSKDIDRRFSVQPSSEAMTVEEFSRRQSMKPGLETSKIDDSPRNKSLKTNREMIPMNDISRPVKADNFPRRQSMQPGLGMSRSDYYPRPYDNEQRRHSVHPEIKMKKPEDFPEHYAEQPRRRSEAPSRYGYQDPDSRRYESAHSSRRASEGYLQHYGNVGRRTEDLHRRSSQQVDNWPQSSRSSSRRASEGYVNMRSRAPDPNRHPSEHYYEGRYDRNEPPRRQSEMGRYRGDYRKPSQMYSHNLASINDGYD